MYSRRHSRTIRNVTAAAAAVRVGKIRRRRVFERKMNVRCSIEAESFLQDVPA